MRLLKQSTAANVMVFMTDSADHVAGKTGLTLTITASKDGAAFAAISPTVTERGNGWYNLALTTAHTDTLGDLAVHVTATGADPTDLLCRVSARVVDDVLPTASYTAPDNATIATIAGYTDSIESRLPAALVGGRMDVSVGAMEANVLTASALAADAAAEIADAVWDEAIAGHLGAGSTGLALNSAGSAGDPWGTALPGAYGAGTAGQILGDNLNATVSSRATQSSVDTIDDFLDTEIAAIKAKTDNLPAVPAAAGDAMALTAAAVDAILDDVVDGGYTVRQLMRGFASALMAKLSGADINLPVFRDVGDTKNRITATTDASGNRTAVTLDLT